MNGFFLQPTEMAQLDALLSEAQFYCEFELRIDIKAYLTHTLMRFSRQTPLVESVSRTFQATLCEYQLLY